MIDDRLWPDRGDGRKAHYGEGRQPIDDIRDAGWAPPFAASCILRYLRRTKDPAHSLESARWYWRYLNDLCRDDDNYPKDVKRKLVSMLSAEELAKLKG